MLNRVVLMGRLVAVPELKTTATGKSVTSFRIAVERRYVKQGEERKADFFDIVCWGNTAEFVCRYFTKGSLIALEGRLQSRTYQATDGSNRYVSEIVTENVFFTGERRDNSNNEINNVVTLPGQTTTYEKNNTAAPAEQPLISGYTNSGEMQIDDDLPF